MKGMLSIPEGVLCMANKPKLSVALNVVDGWFDDPSRMKILAGLHELSGRVARHVEFEVLDVHFIGQPDSQEAFSGVVTVCVTMKGISMSTGFFRGPKKVEDFRFPNTWVIGDIKRQKKDLTPNIHPSSVKAAVARWEKEFKDFLKQYLNQEIRAYRSDLKRFQEHLDFLHTGKWLEKEIDV